MKTVVEVIANYLSEFHAQRNDSQVDKPAGYEDDARELVARIVAFDYGSVHFVRLQELEKLAAKLIRERDEKLRS